MASQDLITSLKKVLPKQTNLGLILLFAALLLIIPIIIIRGSQKGPTDNIREDQIKLQKGDKTVIVSQDGTVEYISSEGVYYDHWDSTQVSSFFSSMRLLAKKNLNKAPPTPGTEGYWLTLYIDGKLVKVFIEGTNEEIEEILNQLAEEAGIDLDFLSDLFEEFFASVSPTPTPIDFTPPSVTSTLFPTSTPTPIPGSFSGGGTSVEEDCRLWLEQGGASTIISNTVCIQNITPTP